MKWTVTVLLLYTLSYIVYIYFYKKSKHKTLSAVKVGSIKAAVTVYFADFIFPFFTESRKAGWLAQAFRVVAARAEDMGLVPNTLTVAQNCL